MKSIPDHLSDIRETTTEYVALYSRRRSEIIEAARDGATVMQLAEAALLPPGAVAAILGEEWASEVQQ